jgi:battenin
LRPPDTTGADALQVLPFAIPAVYAWVLPAPGSFAGRAEYRPLARDEDHEDDDVEVPAPKMALSAADKWRIVRPLVVPFMLPLCTPPSLHRTPMLMHA